MATEGKQSLNYYYANHERCKARARDYHARHPEVRRASKERSRAKAYGLTVPELRRLLKKTKCDVCKIKFDELPSKHKHIDHCHASGKARGVLCIGCNFILGKAKDDPKVLRAAIRYLEKHK